MSVRQSKRREPLFDSPDYEFTIENDDKHNKKAQIKGDEKNVAILFILYLLQGIPLGLMRSMPLILADTGISYTQQAQFSFVFWPFSIKLLWAPIVDSIFWSRMGRRKSWLIPTQYLIGFVMLLLSGFVDGWIGTDGDKEPNIIAFFLAFFVLNFLAATQDIAVDGWALTMLRKENVGYASTCNSVGQTAGYMLGHVAFIALGSPSFCNTYLRDNPDPRGIVTLAGFLQFWGYVFLISTTLIWIFKSEKDNAADKEEMNVMESYKMLLKIILLKPVWLLSIILLTAKIAFGACDAVSGLKLMEAGFPKEKLALMAIPLIPLQILLPLYLSKTTAGPQPMNVYLKAYPYRICFALLLAGFVFITPSFIVDGALPFYYYASLLGVYGLYQVALYSMFVAQMAYFAKISDPSVGGTYMTLLNTMANLGANWPSTVALWFTDGLTMKQCSADQNNYCVDSLSSEAEKLVKLALMKKAETQYAVAKESDKKMVLFRGSTTDNFSILEDSDTGQWVADYYEEVIDRQPEVHKSDGMTLPSNNDDTSAAASLINLANACAASGGKCETSIDGYYVEILSCTVIGILWLLWGRRAVNRLHSYPMRAFSVR